MTCCHGDRWEMPPIPSHSGFFIGDMTTIVVSPVMFFFHCLGHGEAHALGLGMSGIPAGCDHGMMRSSPSMRPGVPHCWDILQQKLYPVSFDYRRFPCIYNYIICLYIYMYIYIYVYIYISIYI